MHRHSLTFLTILTLLTIFSCRETADRIVKATITGREGVRLDLEFNQTKGTAVLFLNGKKMELRQDTMASGIHYSNLEYVYSEWHGRITLMKAGDTVFTNIPAASSRTLISR